MSSPMPTARMDLVAHIIRMARVLGGVNATHYCVCFSGGLWTEGYVMEEGGAQREDAIQSL